MEGEIIMFRVPRKIQPYEQTTPESCLAASLLMLLDNRPIYDKEFSILKAGLEFTRWNFVAGHLAYVCDYYKKRITWYIEFKKWFDFLGMLKISPLVEVEQMYVDKKFINRISRKRPVIVYLDSFVLHGDVHYPHAVVVDKEYHGYTIHDPWDGRTKSIPTSTLLSGISELRERLNYSPQIIKIE